MLKGLLVIATLTALSGCSKSLPKPPSARVIDPPVFDSKRVYHFDIGTLPVRSAINAWWDTTQAEFGVRSVDWERFSGLMSSPVRGEWKGGEALCRLVKGAGLSVSYIPSPGGGVFTIEPRHDRPFASSETVTC